MTDNTVWLLAHAGAVIRYILTGEGAAEAAENAEAQAWLARLGERAATETLGAIHGSHDYRMENILGKCTILGLTRDMPALAESTAFLLRFLDKHTQRDDSAEPLSFGGIYANHDYETVLACFLPMLGYTGHEAVRRIARKRLELLYGFTRQNRYDIYMDGAACKSVPAAWRARIIDPALYADGNIALPTVHDLILLAGMMNDFTPAERDMAENIVSWVMREDCRRLGGRYGYFYVPGGSYNAKSIVRGLHLADLHTPAPDKGDLTALVYQCWLLAHFTAGRGSEWFALAMAYLEQSRTEEGRYRFPPHMLAEKPDAYVTNGGHMNAGEDRRGKQYREILSTFWTERIRRAMEKGRDANEMGHS